MKRVYGSHDPIQIAQLRSLLEASHIACITRNDFLMGAAGELPVMACWPELWVIENFQHEQARALIDAFLHNADASSPWICPQCAEPGGAPFSQCWRCGHERPPWEQES